jgi:hypothetical protein
MISMVDRQEIIHFWTMCKQMYKHLWFVRDVIRLCDYRISVKTFYNWEYRACRIPIFAKRAIEQAAGCTIFIWRGPFLQ